MVVNGQENSALGNPYFFSYGKLMVMQSKAQLESI